MFIIYKLTRNDNKIYIGITKSSRFKTRLHEHSVSNRFKNYNFTHEILERCNTIEDCLQKEKYYVELYDSYNNGLNLSPDGSGNHKCKNFTTLGLKFSRETKNNISKSLKGRIPWNKGKNWVSDNLREQWSKKRKGRCFNSKLNELQVKDIRNIYSTNNNSLFFKKYSKIYNVTTTCLRDIINNKTWKNV